jgi:hypothetical protein
MGTANDSIQRQQRNMIPKGLGENLSISVQKSYFMLSDIRARGPQYRSPEISAGPV